MLQFQSFKALSNYISEMSSKGYTQKGSFGSSLPERDVEYNAVIEGISSAENNEKKSYVIILTMTATIGKAKHLPNVRALYNGSQAYDIGQNVKVKKVESNGRFYNNIV